MRCASFAMRRWLPNGTPIVLQASRGDFAAPESRRHAALIVSGRLAKPRLPRSSSASAMFDSRSINKKKSIHLQGVAGGGRSTSREKSIHGWQGALYFLNAHVCENIACIPTIRTIPVHREVNLVICFQFVDPVNGQICP